MLLDLTIAVPVKNEEINLEKCLLSIGKAFAGEVVVIDSLSTDSTKEVALKYGAKVVDFVWDGKFPKKRNWFLRNHTPKTKWVLFLDADEFITEAFKNELRLRLQHEDKIGYWLNYDKYFLGERLKGGYPLRKLALFRVGAGEYERIEEEMWSHLDMEVHEHPVLKGKVGSIRSKIEHREFQSLTHFVCKHIEYADWEAARFLKVSQSGYGSADWTWKQLIKYKLINSIFLGPIFFFGCFILYGGFRDGSRGLAYAILKMSYYIQVYGKIALLKAKYSKLSPSEKVEIQEAKKSLSAHDSVPAH